MLVNYYSGIFHPAKLRAQMASSSRASFNGDVVSAIAQAHPLRHTQFNVKLEETGTDVIMATTIWLPYDLPWTHGNSAETVLKSALSFLSERCSKD